MATDQSAIPSTVAVVFDFDGTLMVDSTKQFLEVTCGKASEFWAEADALVEDGWDFTLAWLHLFKEWTLPGMPLAGVRDSSLVAFGKSLDRSRFFPGFPELLDELKHIVEQCPGVAIQFYIVSGGLKPIIEASPVVRDYFGAVYASELGVDPATGAFTGIKRAVTFTEKTRYLFEIHKGLDAAATAKNPFLVNQYVAPSARPVPFANMIYVGDGLTDVPCFSLVESNRGLAFGVLDRKRKDANAKVRELLPHRVRSLHDPDYQPGQRLAQVLQLSVASIAGRISALRDAAYPAPDVTGAT